MHMVRDLSKGGQVGFRLYYFFNSGVMPLYTLARSRGICVIWTHSSIIFVIVEKL
jgi:hypothetical protein